MKPALITLALIAPLSALAQNGVYSAVDGVTSAERSHPAAVGLDGPLGVVALGHPYQLLDDSAGEAADVARSMASMASLVGSAIQRYDSTIQYTSPRARSGLIGSAIYSVGESPFNSKVNRAYGATIGYEKGRVNLSLTHQRKDNLLDATGTMPAVDQSARNTLVAANFDFGRLVGYAAYGHSKGDGSLQWDESNPYGAVAQRDPSTNSRDVLLGVALPMGATTWLASVIHKDDRSLADRDANQLAVGASYAFSRRTNFYASFAKIQNRNGAAYTAGNAGNRSSDHAINLGLRHAF